MTRADYIQAYNLSGLKVGDEVIAIKIEIEGKGWGNTWVPEMDEVFGKKCKITCADTGGYGVKISILLEDNYSYPWFIFRKVHNKLRVG